MNRRMMILIIFSLALHFAVLGALTVSMKTQDFELGTTFRSETLALEWGLSTSPPDHSPSKPNVKSSTNTIEKASLGSTTDPSTPANTSHVPNQNIGSSSGTPSGNSSGPIAIGSADPYYSEVRARIQSRVTYTPALARRRLQGQVQVTLTLLSNGGIASLDVAKSSGSADLDRLALESVRAAAPFPTFQCPASARKLELPIDFRLH